MRTSVLIVGAGLAGLFAALRLQRLGVSYLIVDAPKAVASNNLGGFAAFSGAKFSLPPAGLGLLDVLESEAELRAASDDILSVLLLPSGSHVSGDVNISDSMLKKFSELGFSLRSYSSYVLSPQEIDGLITRISEKLHGEPVLRNADCESISRQDSNWHAKIHLRSENRVLDVSSDAIIYAGGRSGASILRDAGALPVEGKGIDLGFRVEYTKKEGLHGLRALGPDAKILRWPVRTFCLNHPGRIYHYQFSGLRLPGGVVEVDGYPSANFAVLARVDDKENAIARCLKEMSARSADAFLYSFQSIGDMVANREICATLDGIFGISVRKDLLQFFRDLRDSGVLPADSMPFSVHLPLMDWHWDVFAGGDTFRTSLPALWAVGDVSGKARGLLQACVSGDLGAAQCATSLK